MVRAVPRYAVDRMYGEGDGVIRNAEGKIIAWSVGTSEEELKQILKENPGSYESVALWDTEKEAIV